MFAPRLISLAALALLCGGAVYLIADNTKPVKEKQEQQENQAEPGAGTAGADERPDAQADAASANTQTVVPKAPSKPKFEKTDLSRPGAYLALPDGSRVPVLNGAYGAPAMDWPAQVPWSPIKGREVDSMGYEWYLHEDGSKSITRMTYHSQLGREEPTTSVYNPIKPLPLDPVERRQIEEQMKKKKVSK